MPQIAGKQIKPGTITDAQVDSTVIIAAGTNPYTGDQSMGSNKLTGVSDGTAAGDAVNKGQLDGAIAGITWVEPAEVNGYHANLTIAGINGLTPALGDAVVATDAGTPTAGASDALLAGDIAEFNGTEWKLIVTNSGGFPPVGTRAIVSTTATLLSPLTGSVDDGKIAEWDGTSVTPALAASPDGEGILVAGEGSVNENKAYVFDGVVPTGTWIQFSGLGLVTAGDGLSKIGNTLDVNVGDGIEIVGDNVTADLGNGLKFITAEIAVEPADIAGAGLEDDGSDNLRISAAAAGDGLTGGAGSPLAVQADGDTVSVSASGVKANTQVDTDKNVSASLTASDDDAATAATLTSTPVGSGYVRTFVNGVGVVVGDGVKTGEVELFFSADGGTTALAFGAITTTSTIHWRGSQAGFELATIDRISFDYLAIL